MSAEAENYGWEEVEPGDFRGPAMVDATTPDFSEHARVSRARWDLFETIKVLISQHKERKAARRESSTPRNLPPIA